jgi:hypothetical protein
LPDGFGIFKEDGWKNDAWIHCGHVKDGHYQDGRTLSVKKSESMLILTK